MAAHAVLVDSDDDHAARDTSLLREPALLDADHLDAVARGGVADRQADVALLSLLVEGDEVTVRQTGDGVHVLLRREALQAL
eukprot:1315885-Prymnesium_polylepis.1